MFNWICPLCAQPLLNADASWRCEKGHNFDRAKSDYINLMPVHHKGSKEPGDSKAMLLARREFLNAGFYEPIAKTLSTTIKNLSLSTDNRSNQLLDCGCGEGYYLQHAVDTLDDSWEFAGIDISKAAVELAAKRKLKESTWVCASSLRLPLADNSIDVALRVFSPKNNEELNRVMRKNGVLIVVTPAEKHLLELKSALYEHVKPYATIETPAGFKEISQQSVETTLTLSAPPAIEQLLSMTPFLWNGRREAREQLLQLETLSVTVHVLVSCYKLLEKLPESKNSDISSTS